MCWHSCKFGIKLCARLANKILSGLVPSASARYFMTAVLNGNLHAAGNERKVFASIRKESFRNSWKWISFPPRAWEVIIRDDISWWVSGKSGAMSKYPEKFLVLGKAKSVLKWSRLYSSSFFRSDILFFSVIRKWIRGWTLRTFFFSCWFLHKHKQEKACCSSANALCFLNTSRCVVLYCLAIIRIPLALWVVWLWGVYGFVEESVDILGQLLFQLGFCSSFISSQTSVFSSLCNSSDITGFPASFEISSQCFWFIDDHSLDSTRVLF